jgi:hypothetical protein
MIAARSTTSPLARRTRGTVCALVVAASLAGLTSFGALEPIKRYSTLALNDGRTLLEVEVINQTMTDVLVRHSGGATTLRSNLLPASVAAELHMPAYVPAAEPALDPSFLALANKVAVAAPTAPAALSITVAAPFPALSDAPAAPLTTASTPVEVATAEPAPAGEGNFIEAVSLAAPKPATAAAAAQRIDLAGRVALTIPGTDMVFPANVEVRAYPAALLTLHLEKARARANDSAGKLFAQAAQAVTEGRLADGDALNLRARRTADQFLDYLPLAPYSARSDTHGHFTLSHDLRDARLVATARLAGPNGEWIFRWIGFAPEKDALLTEANATTVAMPEPERARFAAR